MAKDCCIQTNVYPVCTPTEFYRYLFIVCTTMDHKYLCVSHTRLNFLDIISYTVMLFTVVPITCLPFE